MLNVTEGMKDSSEWFQESIVEIDESAKSLLRLWEERILTGTLDQSRRFVEMYVAFKYMLGHKDFEAFPGAKDITEAGVMTHLAFRYIKRQITSGRWDELTRAAIAKKQV